MEHNCTICAQPLVRNRRSNGARESPAQLARRKTCGGKDCLRQHKANVAMRRPLSAAQLASFNKASRPRKTTAPERTNDGCVHHWILSPQYGTTGDYEAMCKNCDAQRTYPRNPDLTVTEDTRRATTDAKAFRIGRGA